MARRVALSTLGSLGDLHPFLELGVDLRGRGHEVTVATSPTYAERVAAHGLGFHPIPPDFEPDDPDVLDAVLDRWNGARRLHTEFVFPHLRGAYEAILPLARRSDVVVRSVLGYHASVAAEVAGVPWMSMQLSPMCMWSAHDPPVLAPLPWLAKLPLGPRVHGALLRGMLRVSEPWAKPVRALREELGLPYHGNPFAAAQFAGRATVAAFSSALQAPQPDWPARVVQTGFLFHDEDGALDADLAAFLDAGEPPVVFTLGSTSVHDPGPALRRMVDAASMVASSSTVHPSAGGAAPGGARCVVLAGAGRREEFAAAASDRLFVGGYAPYAALFPRARLVVHQGGVGTTAQALRAGCPQVVLPHCNDQFDNAYRVERLGIARVLLARKAAAPRLARTVRACLADDAALAAARRAGEQVRSEDGPTAAADVVEAVLAGDVPASPRAARGPVP